MQTKRSLPNQLSHQIESILNSKLKNTKTIENEQSSQHILYPYYTNKSCRNLNLKHQKINFSKEQQEHKELNKFQEAICEALQLFFSKNTQFQQIIDILTEQFNEIKQLLQGKQVSQKLINKPQIQSPPKQTKFKEMVNKIKKINNASSIIQKIKINSASAPRLDFKTKKKRMTFFQKSKLHIRKSALISQSQQSFSNPSGINRKYQFCPQFILYEGQMKRDYSCNYQRPSQKEINVHRARFKSRQKPANFQIQLIEQKIKKAIQDRNRLLEQQKQEENLVEENIQKAEDQYSISCHSDSSERNSINSIKSHNHSQVQILEVASKSQIDQQDLLNVKLVYQMEQM